MVVINYAILWHLWARDICDPVDLHFHYIIPKAFTLPLWTLQQMSTGEVITSHHSTPGELVWPGAGYLPDNYLLVV